MNLTEPLVGPDDLEVGDLLYWKLNDISAMYYIVDIMPNNSKAYLKDMKVLVIYHTLGTEKGVHSYNTDFSFWAGQVYKIFSKEIK